MTDTKQRARAANAIELYRSEGIEARSTNAQPTVEGGPGETAYVNGLAYRTSPHASTVQDHLGSFLETVMPGALNGADTSDVKFKINHSGIPLSRSAPDKGIRTLELDQRSDGLYYRAKIDLRMQEANSLAVALDTGAVDQCSYAFDMRNGKQSWNTDMSRRTITTFGALTDVSVVADPCEPSTVASIERNLARDMHFVRSSVQAYRAGKTISASTKAKLSSAVGHLTAANVSLGAVSNHLAELLAIDDIPGDGTIGGNVSGPPNGNGPAIGSSDGAGSRAARRLLNRRADKRALKIVRKIEKENRFDTDRLRDALKESR